MRIRHEAVVTSISWIPGEVLEEAAHLPTQFARGHADRPPPEQLRKEGALEALRDADQFTCANVLKAWIEVEDDHVVALGYDGGGVFGATVAGLAGRPLSFRPVPFRDLQAAPEIRDGCARFVQTSGGRTGVPLPRRIPRPPYVRLRAPASWTTLALEIAMDGTTRFEVVGASPFPRHWIYGPDGALAAKTGLLDVEAWLAEGDEPLSPWGDDRFPARTAPVETALERELAETIMRRGVRPRISTLEVGDLLTEQHAPGREIYVLLDGVLSVEVDGQAIAEVGPGAILGERAILEGGLRTSTLRAVTRCRVASADPDDVDRAALAIVAQGHGAVTSSPA